MKGEKHTQLFDLQENPWEICAEDLAVDPANAHVVKELRKQLRDLQKKYGDPAQGLF